MTYSHAVDSDESDSNDYKMADLSCTLRLGDEIDVIRRIDILFNHFYRLVYFIFYLRI